MNENISGNFVTCSYGIYIYIYSYIYSYIYIYIHVRNELWYQWVCLRVRYDIHCLIKSDVALLIQNLLVWESAWEGKCRSTVECSSPRNSMISASAVARNTSCKSVVTPLMESITPFITMKIIGISGFKCGNIWRLKVLVLHVIPSGRKP